jgi:hypothetical protein
MYQKLRIAGIHKILIHMNRKSLGFAQKKRQKERKRTLNS